MICNLWGCRFRSSFERTMHKAMTLTRFVTLLLRVGHVVLIAAEELVDYGKLT